MAPILVTGGTGTLGRLVVDRLLDAGYDVRVLSRGSREGGEGVEFVTGDLDDGEGVEAADDGIEVMVHCAGAPKGDGVKARHLVKAASAAGARHLVNISVVGADRVPQAGPLDRAMFGYFGSKLAAERILAGSGLPWTTLRATQFHDLMFRTAQQVARMPVIPVPSGFRFQPVDAGEVADRMVELALGAPCGLVPDLGGPRIYEMGELVRGYLRAHGKHRPIVPVRVPGGAARAFRAGRQPGRGPGRRPPDLGGVPGRAGDGDGPDIGRGPLPEGRGPRDLRFRSRSASYGRSSRKGKNTIAIPRIALLVAVGLTTTGPLAPVLPELPELAIGLLTEPEAAEPVLPVFVALD